MGLGTYYGTEVIPSLVATSTTQLKLNAGLRTLVGGLGLTSDVPLYLNLGSSGIGGIDPAAEYNYITISKK